MKRLITIGLILILTLIGCALFVFWYHPRCKAIRINDTQKQVPLLFIHKPLYKRDHVHGVKLSIKGKNSGTIEFIEEGDNSGVRRFIFEPGPIDTSYLLEYYLDTFQLNLHQIDTQSYDLKVGLKFLCL